MFSLCLLILFYVVHFVLFGVCAGGRELK